MVGQTLRSWALDFAWDGEQLTGRSGGYRNRQRFRDAMMFRLGELDLYPRTASIHTDS